tara:strand:+ start:1441 stop:2634 length:1194 start_codon:yes stop_codon:yes gene_type:complete
MPRVIYLGLFALPEHTPMTLSALQQAPEEVGALTLETNSSSQFEVLSNWLQQESKPEAVLIWPKPTGFIADYLAREEPIEGSLVEWKNMAERLLKLFRRHRSQLTLLGVAAGEELNSSEKLPAKIANETTQVEMAVKDLPQTRPLYRLAAAQLAAEDAELQEGLAFLIASSHACSVPSEETSETVRSALQSAKESHHAKQQLKVLTNERDRAMEESKLLLTQLNSVQKALEATEQKINKRDNSLEENELLLTQLHIVQEALEEAYIELKSGIGEAEGKRLKGIMTWLRAHARRQSAAVYKGRDNQALKELVDLLEQSELFDADWYLTQYKDIAEANINPAEHFIKFGAIEGRNPGPRFNTEFYVATYPDVAASGHHPLLHYLRDGINEQRKTQESPT